MGCEVPCKRLIAIDREFPPVKITDCLKTGVNTAGNPGQYPPFITTLNAPRRARIGCCFMQPVVWPSSGTLRSARLARDNLSSDSVAEHPVRLSQEA